MLKLKLQYFGHLMRRIDSLEKTLMLGKTEGRRRRGRQRMRWLYGITNLMDMSSASSGNWWWTGKSGVVQSMGSKSHSGRYSLFIYIISTNRIGISSIQFSSVAQLCPTLWNPVDCSMPGLPVNRQFLEFTQTHVHWVGDAIQPSHPLLSLSPPAFNLSQHQGLFKWVSSLHQMAKVLEFQLQHQLFQWIFRTDLL